MLIKKQRGIKVKITFEPNRISKKHLADAYERLLPIVHRHLCSKTQEQQIEQFSFIKRTIEE